MFKRKQTVNQDQEVVYEESSKTTKFKKPNLGHAKKASLGVVLGLFVVFTALQTTYTIEEDEYAVVKTFGSVQVIETPGFKFKVPYIQQVAKVSKASKQFSVGYDINTNQSIVLYITRMRALIFPKKSMGEEYEAIVKMIHTHMPPSKVKIRHIH